MNIRRVFLKANIWLLAVPILLGSIFVYATIDTTVYTTTELIVIPGVVETTEWTGLDSVLIQDVGEYALHQDFSNENSAIPLHHQTSPAVPEVDEANTQNTDSGSSSTEAEGVNVDGSGAVPEPEPEPGVAPLEGEADAGSADSGNEPPQSTDAEVSENESESVSPSLPEPSPIEPEEPSDAPPAPEEPQAVGSAPSKIVWGAFPIDHKRYPLAQVVEETVAEEVVATEPVPEESVPVVVPETEPVAEESAPSSDESNEVIQEGSQEGEVTADPAGVADQTVDESVGVEDVQSVNPDTELNIEGAPLGGDIEVETIPPCNEAEDCYAYRMTFSSFTLPEFDTTTVLDTAQLRLSLSAKEGTSESYVGPQRFRIEYRYGSSSDYALASIIDVEDEISNSLNGGYYLISFDTPPTMAALSALQVRVVFEGNLNAMEAVHFESIWLEVTAGQFYEDTSLASTTDQISYSRDLEAPKFHTLFNPDIDQSANSLPAFTLDYSPQQNFFKRIFTSVFSDNHYNVEQLRLTDSDGQVIDVPIEVIYHEDTTWTLQFKKQPQKLVAGKYTLEVIVNENDVLFTDSFQFYWGVIAVNTTKSRYFPGEDVRLQLAALTDQGDTICDANLQLKIVDPKNNIYEVPVKQTGACGPNNVTDTPDYVADFIETKEWGQYTVQLQHFNASGELVHSTNDTFEVAEYIPFDIERTAPTRIFPPAPYDVSIKVTAYRDFVGDITERVPRGFVVEGLVGATIESLPEYSQITWSDIVMKEGESVTLSYRFDAPDISPYLYLLGPLDMDGFTERRQWQIASDALNNIGWFEGTRTVSGTNLNTFLESPLQWSTSTIDSYYFAHATSVDSQKVTLRQDGDYFVSVTLPHQRTDGNNTRTRIGVEVKKNGEIVEEGIGRSGFILQGGGVNHTESSSHVNFLLTDVTANDYIEVYTRDLTPYTAAETVVMTEQAAMYVEYIPPSTPVFAGTATSTVASTSLNTTASALMWTETRQDITAYSHSDTVSPQNITLVATGTYLVHVNIPFEGTARDINIMGRVLLDGVQVPGGLFSQGYMLGIGGGTEADYHSSIHWSGVVTSTSTGQVLTITTEQEAAAGTTSISRGYTASIYVEPFPVDDTIVLRGNTLTGGTPTDWSQTTQESVQWTTSVAMDAVTYSHSTTSSSSEITINEGGDYLLTYTDNLTEGGGTPNPRITVEVNGVAVPGAQTKTHINRALLGQNNSSAALVYLIEGISAGQVLRVRVQEEAQNINLNDAAIALLTLTKKVALNERAAAPSFFDAPFDNIRTASTSPYFDFQSNDPDGSSDIQYEFAISTSSDFATSTIRTSGVDAGFSNTASSTDTSPFIESNRIRFQLQPADALTDLTTYYWRVRAKDVTGSGGFGEWSTTQSYTVNLAATVPNWFQTFTGQFSTNALVGAVSSGEDSVQVDAGVNTEILIAYGDGTNVTPRYRLWEGTAWSDPQLSALPVGGTINWVRTAASVASDEYILLTLDQSSSTYAQVFSSTSVWGNQVLLSNRVNNRAHRGIAVGYESQSGDAMAVSCDSGPSPVYRIWSATSTTWSATSSITVSSLNNCSFLEIASDPASDEMILVVRDSGATVGNNYEALVWNGSTWIANRVIGSVAAGQLDRSGIGLAYEASGNQAVIAVTDTTQPRIAYTTWDGSVFTTNTTQLLGNDFEFGRLVADTNSDDMALCYVDEDTDAGVLLWNGGTWLTHQEIETSPNSNTARPIDCEFETLSGRSDNLLITYSDTVAARYQVYAGSWPVTEQSITGVGTAGLFWVQTERAGDGTVVMVSHDDQASGDEIESSYFNGTSWSTKQSIVPNPSSVIGTPYETFDMAAKRFQYAQGVVTTEPIDFAFVPNRATWGDLSFSTTEPFGTNVTVRLKYSSSTECDTYISNAALPGNGTGFDVGSSTLNISSLSTTTYSQICLEATITALGSESASLDDWSVTWLREPKLIQNNYRWYDNGSFLTPTDPWPTGIVDDVLLNTALNDSQAVNINDVIRLRMTLQGSNVDLATSTDAFKLQYAAGQVCSPALDWEDVGAPASTTALWRGYENSIVGSDWLSAAWTRRMKITVEGTLVSGAQTDFPVYVNLDDLPDSFFANVQSDGDDIRITASSGIAELPFELVSINTTTKKGELHFKANLASTTDTDFYIYYGNPSASAYAVTATYGRNNVWTNSYEAVYHLETSPASNMTDSTSNGRTLTTNGGMLASQSIASVLGQGVNFDGVNDRLNNTSWSWTSTPVTVTAWNYSSTTAKQSNLFGFTAVGNERFATHAPWSDSTLYWDYGTCCGSPGRLTANYNAYKNKWTHIGLVSRGSTGFVGIYLDGSSVASSSSSDDPNVTLTGFSLGSPNPSNATDWHRGHVDEFRIASAERSSGWIRTEHNNQSNPTGFYAVSAEELIGDGATLPSTILTGSDYAETYEEGNPTAVNRNAIVVGNDAEWDFALQNYGGLPETEYCFRLVYDDGSTLNTYTRYPQLVTNSPPPAPTLEAPFDNEQAASTTPWFEFYTDDALSDDVSYQVQIDNNFDFTSVTIDRESNANFGQFTNLAAPSERGLYTTGNTIQFIPNTTLSSGTYYWRVRAKDDNGSGAYGEWSTPYSFTVDTTAITTWYQTFGEQFSTNNLLDAVVSTSTHDVGILTGFTNATVTSTIIDYDDKDTGNAWGQFTFNHTVTPGTIRYFFEYNTGGEVWDFIPDAALPGNAAGFTSSPVSLTGLDTTVYNEIRIVAVMSGTPSNPRLLDWKVEWGETIDVPTLIQPFDNAKERVTLPELTFYTTDPQANDLQYEVQISTSYDFAASSTYLSGVDAGFVNVTNGGDTSPFTSGNTIRYTVQSALLNGTTYWWRVRARDLVDPTVWSSYNEPQSFTIDTAAQSSVWFQTTGEQFATDDLINVETTSGGAQVTSVISEVMSVYAEGIIQLPQYRLWNGSTWSSPESAESVSAPIQWTRLAAAPTRAEYVLGTLGTDLDINLQVYNANTGSWGNLFELYTESVEVTKRRFDLSYESTSGDLVAVACAGTDAIVAVWNNTSWSTSTIDLTNTNDCDWVQMSSDPTSDEIIAIFRHTNASTTDFEAVVWNGSTWGNSFTAGDLLDNNLYEGMAVQYEDSGNQAVAVVSNGENNSFLWSAWNGTFWTTATATAIDADLYWASLKRDEGTDNMALCYLGEDNDIGIRLWNGSAWTAFTDREDTHNNVNGTAFDCEFETTPERNGDIVIAYSDTALGRYQLYSYSSTSFTTEANLSTLNDSYYVRTVRGGDGVIHAYALDDGSAPDRYDTSRWDGSTWSALSNFSTNPSITSEPYNGSIVMAAQIFPNFTDGTIRSTPIEFTSGNSPRWERIRWNDTTPGASDIRYRVYYETAPDTYALVPDSALSGNAAGFTNSPVSIATLDRTTYDTLKLEAELICSSGNCPSVQDWSVEWSQGITISGSAFGYDQSTAISTGTIAVAVNGVLQAGKTATLGSGTTTTQVVFDTAGTSTFTVPAGVTNVTVKAWGAGGGAGGGGTSDAGGAGGGGGFIQGNLTVIPAEELAIRIGGGGAGGALGIPPGAGGGGGYSGVFRSSTPLAIAGGGGGGGGGTGGVRFVAAGTACAVEAASCSPGIPAGTVSNDVYILVLHSRTDTAHTCTTNCTGWTEFSTQAGSGTEGRLSVWWYRQSGAPPSAPTFAGPVTAAYTGRIWAYRGVATSGNPYDVLGTNTAITVATTTYAGSNLTSTVPDAMVVHVAGSMDDNTWGPGSGSCTFPTTVNTSFYTTNNPAGADNSISLCYRENPLGAAGSLGAPANLLASNGADLGRYFTFALRPNSTGIEAAGRGGAAGGLVGEAGVNASTTTGGGAGTQSAGGSAGGGTATNGGLYTGGNGSGGTAGGAGGAGGSNGGGAGGTGNFGTLAAAGGGGGAGYYGGGGANSASGVYISGAGGGGGSSFIETGATATSTQSGTASAPANSGDSDYSAGVGVGNTSATSSNGGLGGDGRVVISYSVTNSPGAWSITNVSAFAGDVITVFMQGASGTAEAVGVTKYDGVGDITGMQLSQRHLTIGSDDSPNISNANIGLYNSSSTEDVFFSVTGASVLNLCVEDTCSDARLRILASSTYTPGASGSVINFQNNGTFAPATNTLRVSAAWLQNATFTPDTSTIIFTATTSSSTLENATSTYVFHNVTFGETSGSAVWNLTKPLDITGTLAVDYGTLARGTSSINLEQNLRIGVGGFMSGIGTTTFDGSGSHTWTDSTASSTNVGNVVIDGSSKTITLGGNVGAQSVTIGADDTLNASGSGYNINVVSGWSNNNAFIPQSGTVTFVGTSTTGIINRGASSFNNLTFTGAGSNWSFSTSTLTLTGSFTIATGSVTLPTGTTTIGGSFTNSGGTFLHNNGEVRMTSTAGGRTITQRADIFNNAFYDLVFSGSGAWSYTESAATTTRNMNILAGTVTLASSTLTVGGDFSVTGSGAFAHNNGTLVLLVQGANVLRTNGSSLNNLRTRGSGGSWYNSSWSSRLSLTVQSSRVPANVSDFPVYVNLAHLPDAFFAGVKADGGDIRMTTSDGSTEVPVEIVSINTGTKTGELHFRAPSLSSTTNTSFYVYYGNSAAATNTATSTFGRANVWSNGYEAVYHLGTNPAGTSLDSTRFGRDLTSAGGMVAGNSVAGVLGNAVDFEEGTNDYLRNTTFAWANATNTVTVTAWNNVATSEVSDSNLFGFVVSGSERFASHAPYGTGGTIIYWDYGTCCTIGTARVQTSYTSYLDKWTHIGLVSTGGTGAFMGIYLDGSLTASSTGAIEDPSATLTGFGLGAVSSAGGGLHDGRVDEFRIASVVRTGGWIATERNNQASSTTFYSVGGTEQRQLRTFSDTNTTILGNFTLETGGDATFPSGTLSIGGSFDNDASFNANSGTVRFNSTAGAETIAVGTTSNFATLEFNSATGDFTVTENATATVAINLTSASQFTLTSGRTLSALGTFTNAAASSSTTWTGSTLLLQRGGTTTLNSKTHGGDSYGTLRAGTSTIVMMWNSSADTPTTTGTSSAIYSQDHAGSDGDLNIYGDYVRTTGTEYWSYATDFDGVALNASTSRQVDVRIASSSGVGLSGASLNIVGTTSASTTIDALAGTFGMSATNTTITAEYFTMAGMNAAGLSLRASTTLSTFRDGFFTVIPGRSGITISSTTVAQNPSAQFFRIGFATTSAGAGSNVTLVGTTSQFVWFRTGTGNLYGEAYDAGDANPGSVRFDDSSNSIVVSGVVYADDGVTALGSPTCNGSALNVRIIVDGGTYSSSTSCAAGTGAYSFPAVNFTGDPKVIVYLDTNGGVQGSVVTKTPTTNITNMHIYANRVITRHQDTAPLTAADMATYDIDNDTDIRFSATTSALTVMPGTELFVFATTSFAPGGNVTLSGNGSSTSYEGTLQIGNNATFTANGTETHTLAGRFVVRSGGVFTPASSTVIFNATTSGKSITASSAVTFNDVQFTGVGGTWNIGADLSVLGNMQVATGTVTGTGSITLPNGSLTGNGTLSLGGGTVSIAQSTTLGGTRPWTFHSLTLGNGSVVGTTTPAGTATTTVSRTLTISNAHFLDANDSRFDLTGTSTVLVETGTLLEDTSTFRYSGAGANVTATNYYNLILEAVVGSSTYSALGASIVHNDLTVGGAASTTFTLTTSDPLYEVRGNVLIQPNATLVGSDSNTLTVLGNWDNNGSFSGSGGTVRFTGTSTTAIAAGLSSFSNVLVNGTGTFAITEHATATGAFTLQNHASFTVNSGQSLAVGGQFTNTLGGGATTWTGSTLSLYGSGTYSINASTTSDIYGTLAVGAGTQVRMWNSSSTVHAVNSTGSLYSQDHAMVDGDLYIYGQLTRSSGADYWSYDTDFDGTVLSTSTSRQARVYFASSSSVFYSGGSLTVVGSTTASTTLQNQGAGTYGLHIGGSATTDWDRVVVRDVNASGIVISGTPTVTDFSRTDHLVKINSATAMTVGGTVINQNPSKNFNENIFAADIGVTGATNVTATGTATAAWRFANHSGNLAASSTGEDFDSDPGGDPGYLVWDDSANLITVSGNVYAENGVTVSSVCDGSDDSVRLVVAAIDTYDVVCQAGTGAFTIPNVSFNDDDTLTLYLNDETPKAATISVDPISSISNLHLYENHVIVRHEGSDPITIDDMAVWDSSNDVADIPFTAVSGTPDTLTVPADRTLLIWTGKTFEPNGNVTVSGGGGGSAYDGTLEAQANATFRAKGTETHTVGGSLTFGSGAVFTAAQSTMVFTTTGSGRTVDVNAGSFGSTTFSGSGSWTISDPLFTLGGSYAQSAGAVTFPTGTTTVGAAFNATGGSFAINGSPLVFIATSTGHTVRFDESLVTSLTFSGVGGGWNMTDVHATATASVIKTAGTLTLPSGNFAVGGSFENRGGTLAHNTSDLIMTSTSSAIVRASSSDLHAIRFAGAGPFTLADVSVTFLDDFAVSSGSVAIGTGTLAVGGSFTATGGTFSHASGTVLLNAAAVGKTINPGSSSFYNLQIGAPSGGYTMSSATTTNNFTIASVNSFVATSGATVRVGGVFTNSVGGSATNWSGSTLALTSGTSYSINTRSNAGDTYGTLEVGANTDIRSWYSAAATTTVTSSGSLYSQDNNNVNGHLYIYGDLQLGTSTEYWNYATDFDGTSLTGVERKVSVFLASNATTTLQSGTLQLLGASGNVTSVEGLSSSSTYAFIVSGGTFNANHYSFADLTIDGLQFTETPTITELSNGLFDVTIDTTSLITLSSTTLNANPSKVFDAIGFTASGSLTGYNIELVGDTTNAWRFTNTYGNIDGEAFDIDGIDACGSLRWPDSSCLLTEQTHIRWRNDDGLEGAPDTEWYDADWGYRKRVRFVNEESTAATSSTALKMTVTYDSDMQSDFDDLRFTDDDGTTLLSHWVEKYTASTNAVVWVEVPSVAALDTTTVFMYYGNGSSTSVSSGTSTFAVIDDFEDNGITEYSGDTSLFQVDTTPVYGGTYALEPSNTLGRTNVDGLYRTDQSVSRGQVIRWMQYVNVTAPEDDACTFFGVQTPGSTNQNYAVCLQRFGVDRMVIAENVTDNDSSGTVLASTSVTYSTGWYEVEVDWNTNNTITASLYTEAGTPVASTTASDSSYSSGGFGFSYWVNKGSWDSFTSRTRGAGRPTVYFGAEQTDGGASWASTLDGAGNGYALGGTARLRIAIENSGLDITNQQFRLEYAAKGAAPTCESVNTGNFAVVPNQATCGSSPVCMATSTYVGDGDATTDLLFSTNGAFSSGKVTESPSNQAGAIDINQDFYTELEYVLTPTLNAADAYCFRVTNAGAALDSYNKIAELGLRFDPSVSQPTFNGGVNISLTPGTTTLVVATTSVSDFNGFADLAHATATFYRTSVGASCTPDNNSCYRMSTEAGNCSFTNCSGSSCVLSCSAHVYFHADPTDFGTYSGQEWFAFLEAEDQAEGYGFNTSLGNEVATLRAITVDNVINYGSLEATSDTGSLTPTTTITNLGNVEIDIEVEGTDLTDGQSSSIPVTQQKFSTSTFTYTGCVSCLQLSSSTPAAAGLVLSKPANITPPVEADVYWGIAVPFGINSAPHSGTNIFTPVDP